ncbi:hypothetical protein LUZ60_005132 [Juncus effusus]|nr:hypothetical protein LUZ60_005132 [Juncus effusus]
MAEEKTLGELLAHNLQRNPGNIVIPTVPNFKLNPSILGVLPIFEGHRNENPYTHLGDAPRDWLNHLQGGPFRTFEEVAKRFLKRYYPETLTAKLRSEITGIQQESGENLQEYYERFTSLCASCPNHNLTETSLLDQFLQGMNDLDARLLQCSAGGSFNEMTPSQLRMLIETNAEGMRGRDGIK